MGKKGIQDAENQKSEEDHEENPGGGALPGGEGAHRDEGPWRYARKGARPPLGRRFVVGREGKVGGDPRRDRAEVAEEFGVTSNNLDQIVFRVRNKLKKLGPALQRDRTSRLSGRATIRCDTLFFWRDVEKRVAMFLWRTEGGYAMRELEMVRLGMFLGFLVAGAFGFTGCSEKDDAASSVSPVAVDDNDTEEVALGCEEPPPDEIVADLEPPPMEEAEIQVAPAPTVAPVAVRPAASESIAVVNSPVKMKCMVSSRTPGAIGARTRGCAAFAGMGYETTRYAEFAENDYKDPRREPLSTFSLDVDTASYAMARRALTMGCLPDPRGVRLEEFVNFFAYDYPEPQGQEPIAVAAEYAACPWNAEHRLLRLGVKAKDLTRNAELPPCNLTFLIDVSGSMSGPDRLERAKKGLGLLVEKLRPADHVAVVTYANDTCVVLPATSGAEKAHIRGRIESLQASGGTNGGAGLELAYAEAAKNFNPQANNRVILITDGDFNIGLSGPAELERFISEKRETGVFLSVVGVGAGNYQDAMMKKLANAGNGNYSYLDSLLTAKKVFVDEFGASFTVAKDVKLQIEFNPAQVAGYRLLGYENRLLQAKDFKDDRKDAGEIGSGHSMTAFYEIVPAKGEAAAVGETLKYQRTETVASEELATLKLRWKEPDGTVSREAERPLRPQDLGRGEKPSADFRFAAAVAEFALILSDSKFKGTANFESVLQNARETKGTDSQGLRADFVNQVELAQGLAKGEPKAVSTRVRAARPIGFSGQ